MEVLQILSTEYRNLESPEKEGIRGLKILWKLGKMKHNEYYEKRTNSKLNQSTKGCAKSCNNEF